jgi:hypothetical protein
VAGSSATTLIESTGGTNADLLIGDGTVRYYGLRGVAGGGSLQIRNHTANTTIATFTSTGLAGIGTSPGSRLDVGLAGVANLATSAITSVSTFGVNGSFGFPGLANNLDGVYFGMGAGGSNGIPAGIGFFRESSGWNTALAFYTNNLTGGPDSTNAIQEKMRITSAGFVGIGNKDPGTLLTVGGSAANGSIFLRSGSNNAVQIYSVSPGGAYSEFDSQTELLFRTEAGAMRFSTVNIERARIDTSGRFLVGTSTATANGGTLELSGGITFPATAVLASNANTLDDYEEGEWTPGLSIGASLSDGRYIKIGAMVYCYGSVTFPSTSSGSQAQLTGLPFMAGGGRAGGGFTRYTGISNGHKIGYHVSANSTAVDFYNNTDNGVAISNNFCSTGRLDFCLVYSTF